MVRFTSNQRQIKGIDILMQSIIQFNHKVPNSTTRERLKVKKLHFVPYLMNGWFDFPQIKGKQRA
jgi:hypothetical protein